MGDRQAGAKAVKVGETLTDVKVAAKACTLVAALTEVDAKTFGETLGAVEAEALVGTFFDTLSEVVAKTNAEKNLLAWRLRHRAKQKLTLLQDCRKHICRHTD